MNVFPESQTLLYIKFLFFKGADTLSRKKLSENNHTVELDHIIESVDSISRDGPDMPHM